MIITIMMINGTRIGKISDFLFDNSLSGTKLNIPDSAKDNSIQVFEMLWTREITDILDK